MIIRVKPLIVARYISIVVLTIINISHRKVYANDIQFNTDILDVKDREHIDLSRFSKGAYIMPGEYTMKININEQSETKEYLVRFYQSEISGDETSACLTNEMIDELGLKPSINNKLKKWHNQECISLDISGVSIKGDVGASILRINVPQAYLEYSSENWEPPSRWEDGIDGVILDYNIDTQYRKDIKQSKDYNNLNANGTLGSNFGPWRLRADWQSRLESDNDKNSRNWEWSRIFAYRALPTISSKLSIGENYTNSDLFDSFRFSGFNLASDDTMLPPNLRGYAPEITGIAKTNAKITVSQLGRIIYQSQVAAGPFRIQDLNSSVTGSLDVKIEEQDGSVRTFKMDTSSIPYLTRPGSIRYKLSAGRPSDLNHDVSGPTFGSGEMSWGIDNGWSLYGGTILENEYKSIAVGLGRDLLAFGAISFDITQSRAELKNEPTVLKGKSYRLSYSKRFDETDSQITFAGYRFSEENFMSMNEYLSARDNNSKVDSSKELYTISFNQRSALLGLSLFLNYNHQTYWNRADNDRYDLTLAKYFDLGKFKNINVSMTGYRNESGYNNDNGVFLSMSLPVGNSGTISYYGSADKDHNTNQIGYYDRIDEHNSYDISTGMSDTGFIANGNYMHESNIADLNTSASYQEGSYNTLGLSVQGGFTATAKGAALHRIGRIGGTRMLIDTDNIDNIPVRGYGSTSKTNRFGKAVITDLNSYYKNKLSIDLDTLPEDAEALSSVVQATLTEGAVGYRKFNVISGDKGMAVIKLNDGSSPPFGATVLNSKEQEVGVVNDSGQIYLSGIKSDEKMTVKWNETFKCKIQIPSEYLLKSDGFLLLPCTSN